MLKFDVHVTLKQKLYTFIFRASKTLNDYIYLLFLENTKLLNFEQIKKNESKTLLQGVIIWKRE